MSDYKPHQSESRVWRHVMQIKWVPIFRKGGLKILSHAFTWWHMEKSFGLL